MNKISLYECSHPKVVGTRIKCDAGHGLGNRDDGIPLNRMAHGKPLVIAQYQGCADFDRMGPPVPPEDRGWLRIKSKKEICQAR